MRYLGLTTLLTITVLAISIYSLSFTIITRQVEQKANNHAKNSYGGIDFEKKDTFLQEQEEKTLYKLPLLPAITYQYAKANSLKLGLDLQGGTHIGLRIDTADLLKQLAGHNQRQTAFIKALEKTKQSNPDNTHLFITTFIKHYTTLSTKPIHKLFTHSTIQTKLNAQSTPQDITKAIEQHYKQATKDNVRIYQNRVGNASSITFTIEPRQQTIHAEAPGDGQTNKKRLKNILETPGQLNIYKVKTLDKQQQENFITQLNKTVAQANPSKKLTPLNKLLITSQEGIMLCKENNITEAKTYLTSEYASLLLPYGLTPIISSKTTPLQDNTHCYTIHFADTLNPILKDNDIQYAEMDFQLGSYMVKITTTSLGAKKLRRYTASNIGERIMIAFDNQAYTVPTVQSEIPNGQCQISGNMSEQEAIDLANICSSGAVTPTQTIEETIIGPTLSKQAQDQGLLAVILALLLILLFMTLYYGIAGIISSLALIINAIIILGTLAQLKAALTLPGIAGLIISLGTGIDGNVIINEAIIDQLHQGNNLKNAINNGYIKSYSSIIDANITTILASIILYLWGQGAIKGFAITLTIGTISSCFTSVLVTRVIKELFIHTIGINRLSFSLFKRKK